MPPSTERGELDLEGSRPWCSYRVADEAGAVAVEAEEEGIDYFDQLLDTVILVIFNRIGEVKAFGRCCVVSHRFHSLVPLVDYVVVRIDCNISDDLAPSTAGEGTDGGTRPDKGRDVFSHLTRLVLGGLVKPLQALGQILAPASSRPNPCPASSLSSAASRRSSASSSSSSCSSSEVSHHSPTEVLKNFKEICRLRIELPAGELGVDDDILLKWKADFSSTLDSCVLLGTSSVLSSSSSSSLSHPTDDTIGPKYLWAVPGWHGLSPGEP